MSCPCSPTPWQALHLITKAQVDTPHISRGKECLFIGQRSGWSQGQNCVQGCGEAFQDVQGLIVYLSRPRVI